MPNSAHTILAHSETCVYAPIPSRRRAGLDFAIDGGSDFLAREIASQDDARLGHYHETCEKIGGKRLIKTLKLTRLRVENA